MEKKQGKILIVEDEYIISFNIQVMLEELGYTVIGCLSNPVDVLSKINDLEVDLIIMDIMLKGNMDGIELAEAIRKNHDIPVVFLTAYSNPSVFTKAKSTQPYGYLLKPFTGRELEINIELALFRHASEKKIRSMQAALHKMNAELEHKIHERTQELEKMTETLLVEIGERKAHEKALEQSEKDYRELFEKAHDAILILDPVDERVLHVNKTACTTYGFTYEEFIGISMHDLSQSESHHSDFFSLIEKHGGKYFFESSQRKKDGTLMHLEISTSVIRYKSRLAFLSINRDVTKRKIAEKALTESEEKYRHLTNLLPIPIFETDADGLLTYLNSNAYEMLGYSPEEAIGKMHLVDLFVPESRERMIEMLQLRLEGKVKTGNEYVVQTRNRTRIRVLGYSSLSYKNGKMIGLRGCLIDIGELTKTQEQLHKFSMVIEQIRETVMITDPQGIIEYVNPSFLHEYGYELTEVIGKTPSVLKSGMHDNDFYKALWTTLRTGQVFSAEFTNVRHNGEIYYADKTITPLRDRNGNITHYVSSGRNITEKKLAEQKLFEHQRFINTINNTVPLVVFVFDIPGRSFTFVNNQVYSVLGYQPEEFLSFSIFDFARIVHPNDRIMLPRFRAGGTDLETGISEIVMKLKNKTGRYRWIQFRGVPFVQNEGRITQVLGTAMDVTDQKNNERKLNAMMRLHRLQEKKEQKIRMFSLLQGQEEERKRLSRELHDGIGQLLTATKMRLNNIETADSLPDEVRANLTALNNMMRETIIEVRRVSNDLVPIGLYDFGLSSVLRQTLDHVTAAGKTKVSYYSNIGTERFASIVEIAVFRVFQEIINNIMKHSRATTVDVSLMCFDNILQLKVADDGVGFNFDDSHNVVRKGNGVNNMHERARVVGGELSITSSPGKGCKIALEVKLKGKTE